MVVKQISGGSPVGQMSYICVSKAYLNYIDAFRAPSIIEDRRKGGATLWQTNYAKVQ